MRYDFSPVVYFPATLLPGVNSVLEWDVGGGGGGGGVDGYAKTPIVDFPRGNSNIESIH